MERKAATAIQSMQCWYFANMYQYRCARALTHFKCAVHILYASYCKMFLNLCGILFVHILPFKIKQTRCKNCTRINTFIFVLGRYARFQLLYMEFAKVLIFVVAAAQSNKKNSEKNCSSWKIHNPFQVFTKENYDSKFFIRNQLKWTCTVLEADAISLQVQFMNKKIYISTLNTHTNGIVSATVHFQIRWKSIWSRLIRNYEQFECWIRLCFLYPWKRFVSMVMH